MFLSMGAVFAFICWILSLGPYLIVNGAATTIHMPFAIMSRLPLLENVLPSRLSMAEWLLVPIVVALIIVEWQRDYAKARKNGFRHQNIFKGAVILLTIAVLITLLPRWPYPVQATNIPSVFATKSNAIPANTIVLTYPYPLFPSDQAMLWQANNGMRFKLLGAYIQNRSSQGTESEFPALLSPPSVQAWLAHEEGISNAPWPPTSTLITSDLRAYLSNNDVGAVVVSQKAMNSAEVVHSFNNLLGRPRLSSGIFIWGNVQSKL